MTNSLLYAWKIEGDPLKGIIIFEGLFCKALFTGMVTQWISLQTSNMSFVVSISVTSVALSASGCCCSVSVVCGSIDTQLNLNTSFFTLFLSLSVFFSRLLFLFSFSLSFSFSFIHLSVLWIKLASLATKFLQCSFHGERPREIGSRKVWWGRSVPSFYSSIYLALPGLVRH